MMCFNPPLVLAPWVTTEEGRELAAQRRDLETREEAVRDTGREVGLSLDEGRSVLGRERDKLRDEAEQQGRVRRTSFCPILKLLVRHLDHLDPMVAY